MDLSAGNLAVAAAVAVAAGMMRGFAGVGSGMLMAPVFAILFGPVRTVAIIVLMDLVATAQLLPGTHRQADWKLILPMGAAAALTMPAGTWLLVSLDPVLLARAIALVVVVFAVVLMFGWRHRGERTLRAGIGVGVLSGFLMGSTSLGNPPVMVYLLSGPDAAEANRANFTAYFAVTLVALGSMMAIAGLIDRVAVLTAAALLPLFLLATWAGAKLFRKSSEALYRRVALALLLGVGLYGMFR